MPQFECPISGLPISLPAGFSLGTKYTLCHPLFSIPPREALTIFNKDNYTPIEKHLITCYWLHKSELVVFRKPLSMTDSKKISLYVDRVRRLREYMRPGLQKRMPKFSFQGYVRMDAFRVWLEECETVIFGEPQRINYHSPFLSESLRERKPSKVYTNNKEFIRESLEWVKKVTAEKPREVKQTWEKIRVVLENPKLASRVNASIWKEIISFSEYLDLVADQTKEEELYYYLQLKEQIRKAEKEREKEKNMYNVESISKIEGKKEYEIKLSFSL